MKQKDIKELRYKLWIQNNKKCPVLDKIIPFEKTALDHNHKKKNEAYSEDKGTVRECLEFRVNAVLGKLENSIKRYGLDKDDDFNLSDFLRNAADYFEKGAYKDNDNNLFIHPNEVYKSKKLKKSSYNKLKKVYNKRAKFPEYPKTKILTKKLEQLFDEYDIVPSFY